MKRAPNAGFTIVESLIVLGISGVLFVAMVALVSGQQAKARFESSMTDIRSQIQQNINEVSAGFYPSNADFTCQNVGGTVSLTFPTSGSQQGTNDPCIFLGRALMLGIPDTDPQEYKIHTLVGVRSQTNGREVTDTRQAGTRAIAPGTAYNPSWQDRSESRALQYGTTVKWMRQGTQQLAGFAIVLSPGAQVTYGAGGALDSGSIVTNIVPIRKVANGGTPGVNPQAGVDLIARVLGVSGGQALTSTSTEPTQICFLSGGTNRSGLVTIGANNSSTSVEMQIHGDDNCGFPDITVF